MVDELPLVALLAGLARGETVVEGVQELRVKETDRVETVKDLLRPLGIRVSASEDALRMHGVPSRPKGGEWPGPKATTGWRCSARSRASSRARGCGSRAPRRRR